MGSFGCPTSDERPQRLSRSHSRSGFSRERMGAARAAAFDREAYEHLSQVYPTGMITLRVVSTIVWGIPQG